MKQSKNIRRGRPWLLLLALLAWLLPQQAVADTYDTYVDMSYNYGVSLDGSNTVKIHVPVYVQEGADCWIKDGKLKVSVAGGSEITLFRWQASEDIDGSADKCWTTFSTEAGGYIMVTLGNTSNSVKVTSGGSVGGNVIQNNDDAETYDVTAIWYVPYDVLGKKLTFKWDVERNGNSRADAKLTLSDPEAITMPSAGQTLQPIISDAMLSTKFKGQIEVPWFLASTDITKIRYEYTDANNKTISVDMPTNENSGIIRLNATEPHRNFHIVASYRMKGEGTSYYDIENVQSSAENLTMIHAPLGLTATAIDGVKPKVELKWNMAYLTDEDFALTDFFEIQRSLTGEEKDFETIGQEVFTQASKNAEYTFVDSTIVQSIKNGMLKNGGTLDKLTYRVRRTMSQIWGWDQANNCATSASTIVDNLHLLRIANYSAKWEDERAYTVRVSWDYANEYGGVWDDRAKMKLHLVSKNGEGNVVEDRTIEVNQEERNQRYKVVNLSRSCVHYDIEVYVERDKSPIDFVENVTSVFFPIRNEADWKEFRNRVQVAGGKYDVNARLYADFTTSECISWESSYAYRGVFDGNGHTITFNLDNLGQDFVAPFRYVSSATIKNLHTAGTVKGSGRFMSGFIGFSTGSVMIENCRSSVTLNSSVSGDASCGGIIGAINGSSNVVIRNTKFEGSFEGSNCHSNGGFVGWNNSTVTIENCFFAPEHITTGIYQCGTWGRGGTFTIINSHATREYSAFVIIRNASDWHNFAVMVNNAVNQYWVDARLEADIETSEIVGVTEGAAYRGTFDGNGHTLTFNKSDDYEMAPFRYVGDATIKNFHTTGTITSNNMFAAGLISRVVHAGAKVTIENCRSSVTIHSNINGDGTNGGFIGHVKATDASITFRNCRFDGSIEGSDCHSNGGFVGWTSSKVTIENSLCTPHHLSTKTDNCEIWTRNSASMLTLINSEAYPGGYGAKYISIRNDKDWEMFRDMVAASAGNYWIDARLEADITTGYGIGLNSDTPYRGTFIGDGHTLTVDISRSDGKPCGLFCYVGDASIRDLHVKGKITGNDHVGGLIGHCISGSPTVTIDRVWVSTEAKTSFSYGGGVIGHSNYATINMNDCLYDGKVITNNADPDSYAGQIIGWCNGGSWNLQRVYDHGLGPDAHWRFFCIDYNQNTGNWSAWGTNGSSYTITQHGWTNTDKWDITDQNEVVNLMNGRQAGSWKIVDGLAVPNMNTIDLNAGEQNWVNKFGSDNWQLVDGKAVPKMESAPVVSEASLDDLLAKLGSNWVKEGNTINPVTTTIDEPKNDPFPKPTLPDFYHTSNGKIDETLMTETRQSSVVLTWDTDGNLIDYFTVLRREVGQGDDAWEEIATNLDQLSYEDKTVSPLKKYEYKVRATNDCEGVSTTETQVKAGECKHTGRLQGYVRFNDGTGIAGVTINIQVDSVETTVVTDASGHYVADELSYYDKASITYYVTAIGVDNDETTQYAVTFDEKTNDVKVHEITAKNGKRFSGFVMYDGTSIPVKGANFLVNGNKVYNSKAEPLETDYDGSFSFRVLPNQTLTIQAAMDGHTFTSDGWFKGPQGHSFTGDVEQIYFYDSTKVKLAGRVVGGDVQGKLPLDNNLSKNNLGDGLKMVLELEGDNSSWLLYDNLNPDRKERQEVYQHAGGNGHKTKVLTTRKRIEVEPDSLTGEYTLMLPPVRWKVSQVYCKGYATLFQEDQVNEVIDLTDCLAKKDTTYVGTYTDVDGNDVSDPKLSYNAIYNRIYRSPIELTYKQQGFDNFDYFGDKTYTATNLAGDKARVPLVYKGADGLAAYTFGHPVFSLERKYYIQVQVAESYRYNNDPTTERLDIVPVSGGTATMQNGMKAGINREVLTLDEEGHAVFELGVDQVAQLLTGEDALKTVTFTAEHDGTVYQAEPLNGFILNMFPIGAGVDVMTEGQPLLFDILRDPPGAYSSATLSEGSTFNYSYKMDLKTSAGVKFTAASGDKTNSYMGTVTAPAGAGTASGDIFTAENGDATASEFVFDLTGNKAYSYTMTTENEITTSNDPTMVGADADLYIGMVQNIQVMPMSTIRALPDSMYQHNIASLMPIAEGVDAEGNKFHLVRDESLAYGPKLQSQFILSQKQILTQTIPQLAKEIAKLLYIGTRDEAQTMANKTQTPVYLSLREPTDPMFGLANAQYNTTVTEPNDSTHYLIVEPQGTQNTFTDQISEKNALVSAWSMMIAMNEYEKLTADDLVANYDVAGAQSVSYSEQFETNFSNAMMLDFPFAKDPKFFIADEDKDASEMLGEQIVEAILKALETVEEEEPGAKMDPDKEEEPTGSKAEVGFGGTKFKWSLTPVLTSNCEGTYGSEKAYTRKESFTIAPDKLSHLNVDVYRVALPDLGLDEEEEEEEFEIIPDDPSSRINENSDLTTIFMSDKFKKEQKYILKQLEQEVTMAILGPQGFVYRTRGGATANPWEDQRTTLAYNPGTVLDERTLKINNPKIRLDKQSVSGVAVADAARFKVYLANESEKPEATRSVEPFNLFVVDQANPHGAKITIDGHALTANGTEIRLDPGYVTEKTIEVRIGDGFDYEGLRLGIKSPADPDHTTEYASFDVHFLREAGAVNIATPGDKWVLNTNAQEDPDKKRGWYIPVTINGFDRHQHNFDHIEFQYKESQRGEDAWVNLCSFYADSTLMANANGVRRLMEENGNIVTEFYGEGTVIERAYDLRAVLFCRNGNDFLTTSSKIISGIKDTRRPQMFGQPEPKGGILYRGDDIVFNFSEDIEYNGLSQITNFEVKGEVNNNDLSEAVSVIFTNQASVETEAKRNFSGKDVTIDLRVKPDTTANRDMPLFSHGTNGEKLQLWLTQDYKLKAVVNDQEFVSEAAIDKSKFSQVALVINQQDSTLNCYAEGVSVFNSRQKLNMLYNGTGALIFGRTNESDRTASQYYQGRMMEARLWYSAMSGGQLDTYARHRLTGYEKNLVDYYPMDEGSGKYATDRTQGANAMLIGADWALPRGMSLRIEKEDNGFELTQDALNRTSEQDYTLMFWFKTDADGRGTLLSNGRGMKEDSGAEYQFNIGFEGEKLMYRSNGFATEVAGDWSDNKWHHYAMTVNRSRNEVNIYMDKEQIVSFEADSLGGISGGTPMIGATAGGITPMKGYVDELMLFAQALPQTLIKTYAAKSPSGDEVGLMTYLSFDRQERQKDNTIETVAYEYSRKIYLDDMGKMRYQLDPQTKQSTGIPVRDYLFADTITAITPHIDATTAAPVVPYEEVSNLKFNFIGRDNQLMIELEQQASKLHHRNVYVTVRDVEDRHGNAMASPYTASFYVVNSSISWLVNTLDYTVKYGSGEELELPFYNWSASNHTYKIENNPKWLTMNKYTDVIAPEGMDYVTATISKDLNIGSYSEIIYLTDEDGITEPFYLNLTVEGDQPDWAQSVNSELLQNTMSISGQVYLYGELDTDSRDIVGAFDNENVCHGFAHISHSVESGETGLYLTVYDNQASGRQLNFRLWQYSTGRELELIPEKEIVFEKSAVLGTDKPIRFDGSDSFVQNFKLNKGWNWVSFNVTSDQLADVNTLLNNMSWSEGDILTDMTSDLTLVYKDNQWLASDSSNVAISPKKSYAIKVQEDRTFPIGGTVVKSEEERTIELKQGWNGIGYTPIVNLTLETALSDYYDQAEEGDVIKSHTEFAYFSKAGNVGRWRGSLQYMKPGEGYMMLRKNADDAKFTYPYIEPGSSYRDDWTQAKTRSAAAESPSTMSVSAIVAGIDIQEGDHLVAYSNGMVAGEGILGSDTEPAYISIAGSAQQPIWFAIEREGEIVASTNDVMTFKKNAVIGSPDKPETIYFVRSDYEDGMWYTVSGMKLQKRPTRKGVYIYNGKKVVVK